MSSGTVWVVLPALNEAVSLPALIAAFHDVPMPYTIIVVDDGSTDGTSDAARTLEHRFPVTVLMHDRNRGLAAAMRTGLEHACHRAGPDDVIVTMDADDTHRPAQIASMVRAIEAGADVVIASRYAPGATQSGVPAHRRVLSAGIGWMLRVRFGLPGVRDYSCGFRAYRASMLQRALAAYGSRFIESAGFVVMSELLVKLAPFKPRITEIPLDLRYDRKAGASKMPTGRTIAGYLQLMLQPSLRPRA
jgi:dolichol-phosphate mannosyltransferase